MSARHAIVPHARPPSLHTHLMTSGAIYRYVPVSPVKLARDSWGMRRRARPKFPLPLTLHAPHALQALYKGMCLDHLTQVPELPPCCLDVAFPPPPPFTRTS